MELREGRHRAVAQANRLSPEIYHRVGGRYCSSRSRQQSGNRNRRGYQNPTGSERMARCYKEAV